VPHRMDATEEAESEESAKVCFVISPIGEDGSEIRDCADGGAGVSGAFGD
jgi:hypothetical protein